MNIKLGVMRAGLALCVFLQISFFVLSWSSLLPPGLFMQMSVPGLSVAAMRALVLQERLAGAALALPALMTLYYGLWRLERMLANFERHAMFDLATIGHLRAFAGATLLSTLLSIVEPPLRAMVFRVGFGAHDARLSIGVSSEGLLLILVCGLFYLIAHMMHEGRRLAEENAGFV
ncbi:MAG: DUF2975 domain-containing protein [Telluria sp.]|nr:DUF2975 domain-containing protein [Telluria sp.]